MQQVWYDGAVAFSKAFIMGVPAENLLGKTFGRLTVTARSTNPRFTTPAWVCHCACGNTREVLARSLKIGATRSCGCYNNDVRRAIKTTHGCSKHSAFRSWQSMMSRCEDPNDKDYPSYGRRGIAVCDRWRDPAAFVADMGEKPRGLSLERIDNSRGYSPENCRWASPLEQGANKRNNNLLTIGGVQIHLADAARKFGLTETTIRRRLEAGMSGDQIVAAPVRRYARKAA